jgi:hypothetical protein
MTIYAIDNILSSKPHNSHYLKRYIWFIESCRILNEDYIGYTEKHHICPKAKDLFPEYKSLKKHPWNKVVLTPRQQPTLYCALDSLESLSGNEVYGTCFFSNES